jgi:hypothetical protein
MPKRPFWQWTLAIVITLVAAVYQRGTGPTYPRRVSYELGGSSYAQKLPRSHGGATDCPVAVEIPDREVTGKLRFRRYPTDEEWTETPLRREGDVLEGELPHQPPAGKLEYVVVLEGPDGATAAGPDTATVIRFKGYVPPGFLFPHVFFMFLAMLVSTLAGVKALAGTSRRLLYTWVTVVLLFLGGLVFGPIVQKYAFGDFWTGIPFGWDLTDNKVAVAFAFWAVALLANLRKRRPLWIVLAAVMLLVVYSIPHSVMGSELDPATGEVMTG